MDSKPSIDSSEKETPKRLAFSVENILDPNKFTGKRLYGQSANGTYIWGSIDRDDKMDDDQSDGHSSEWFLIFGKVEKSVEILFKSRKYFQIKSFLKYIFKNVN